MNKAVLRKLLNFIFSAKLYSSSQGQHMQRNKLYALRFYISFFVLSGTPCISENRRSKVRESLYRLRIQEG